MIFFFRRRKEIYDLINDKRIMFKIQMLIFLLMC